MMTIAAALEVDCVFIHGTGSVDCRTMIVS
jgi:hypothetical protein